MTEPATIPEEKDMSLLDIFAKIIFEMVIEEVEKDKK